jgi:hypothetical protein
MRRRRILGAVFKGLTPWAPILFVAVVVVGGALVVLRLTGRSGYAWAYGLFVIGLALAAFGTIATAMFAPAAILGVSAIAVVIGTRTSRDRGSHVDLKHQAGRVD